MCFSSCDQESATPWTPHAGGPGLHGGGWHASDSVSLALAGMMPGSGRGRALRAAESAQAQAQAHDSDGFKFSRRRAAGRAASASLIRVLAAVSRPWRPRAPTIGDRDLGPVFLDALTFHFACNKDFFPLHCPVSAFLFSSLKAPRPASVSGVIHICVLAPTL